MVVVIVAAMCLAGALPIGAAPAGGERNTLVVAKSDEPNSIDPQVHDGWYSVRAQSAVYEALVDLKWDPAAKKLAVLPLLATSWKISPDGLTYSFALRPGVKFSDGTALTSDDVKATFERNRALKMRTVWQVEPIDAVTTPDEHTVVMKLKRRFTPFLYAMGRAYIMSAKAIRANDHGDNAQPYFNSHMLGTGPYKFVEWSRQSTITFEKNPEYWGGWSGSHFDRIVLRHVPDPATQRLLAEKGDVDFALQIAPDDAVALKKNQNVVVLAQPVTATFGFPMKARGALKDTKVRQALEYSFPYTQVLQGLRKGFGARLYGPFPRGVPGYTEQGLTKYDYAPDKAKALLAEAGYKPGPNGLLAKDGKPLSFEVWTLAGVPYEKDVALLWQQALRQIGVTIRVTDQSNIASYVTATYNFDATADMYGWVTAPFIPDPHDLARQFSTKAFNGLNTAFWGNAQSDSLIDLGSQMAPGPARTNVYERLERMMNADPPAVWAWQEEKIIVHSASVGGYMYDPLNMYPREIRYYDLYRK